MTCRRMTVEEQTVNRRRILLVDDEAAVRRCIREFLETHGCQVDEADACASAVRRLEQAPPDAVLLDHLLPDGTALDLLPRIEELAPDTPVLVLTGHGSIDLAVRAVKAGADQFLTKPVDLQTLLVLLRRAVDDHRTRRRQRAESARSGGPGPDPFEGTSAAIRRLAEDARRVAASDCPVLIEGSTGTGKGVLAAWVHRQSRRSDEPFVDLNCASLSREFLETELFGHRKGAFTGAAADKPGLLEVAHRGTLFLDEIGDMDVAVQPRLLKVLEDQRFHRMGEVQDRRVDVRLIAATHQDLATLVREKRFREDLLYRISAIPLRVPSLSERREDIPLLARRLVETLGRETASGPVEIAPDALEALQEHAWPGNIRELRNVLERALLFGDRRIVRHADVRFPATPDAETSAEAGLTLAELERRHIERVLQEEGGHVEQAARRLGIARSTLYERIKGLQLEPRR